jgi:predicted Zn-dependent peptidase
MANGVHVLLVERHDLPIVAVRVVSSQGAGDLAGARPGVMAFMGSMLEQGAGIRDALALSDQFESLGADHGAWCDWDSCGAHIKVLTSRLPLAMDLLTDVVLRPTFPDAEIERLRKRMVAYLQQEKSSPGAMEQNALAAAVFGRHSPYGHSLHGALADMEKLKRADVEGVYKKAFEPKSTTIVAAGDVTAADLRALLDARFGAWKVAAAPAQPLPPAAPPAGKPARVVLVDSPGAAQSQVFLAEEGAPENTPDRIPLGVMNAILGGMFSSRINLDLREEHSYTYGAHSHFVMRHRAGPFVAGGAIFAAHTVDAIHELLAQVGRIRDQPVSAEELADAKENAKLALPARFESVDEVAGALADIAVYGLPLDEYATRTARIDAVTVDDVQRVAKKWLRPDALRIVVTGDKAKLDAGLSALGTIEVRDAYGDLVK